MVQLVPKIPDSVPSMVYDYLEEAKRCLVNHTYKSVVLLSAAALEVYLRERLKSIENALQPRGLFYSRSVRRIRVHRMTLEQLIDWARIAGFLTNVCWKKAHKVRERRNRLIHPKDYSEIVKKESSIQRLATRIEIRPRHLHCAKELKSAVAFRFSLRKFAEESLRDVLDVVDLLYTDLSLPGMREQFDPSLQKKIREKKYSWLAKGADV